MAASQNPDREFFYGVCEIVEALESPAVLNDTGRLLEITSLVKTKRPDLVGLIEKADRIFTRRKGKNAHDFIFHRDEVGRALAEQFTEHLPKWPCVIYHGTSTKVLRSIHEGGLSAGQGKSRWKRVVDDDHLKQGVFVADNFKAAAFFAQATALTRTGDFRKDGSKPVVIRMLVDDVNLQPDLRATVSGCWVSSEDIQIDAADATIVSWGEEGQGYDYPVWQPIGVTIDAYRPGEQRSRPR